MEYEYPIDYDWSNEEIITVINLYNAVEQAYEVGIKKDKFLSLYSKFKEIVNSKSLEKQLDKQFEKVSGYSIYQVVKISKESDFIKI